MKQLKGNALETSLNTAKMLGIQTGNLIQENQQDLVGASMRDAPQALGTDSVTAGEKMVAAREKMVAEHADQIAQDLNFMRRLKGGKLWQGHRLGEIVGIDTEYLLYDLMNDYLNSEEWEKKWEQLQTE